MISPKETTATSLKVLVQTQWRVNGVLSPSREDRTWALVDKRGREGIECFGVSWGWESFLVTLLDPWVHQSPKLSSSIGDTQISVEKGLYRKVEARDPNKGQTLWLQWTECHYGHNELSIRMKKCHLATKRGHNTLDSEAKTLWWNKFSLNKGSNNGGKWLNENMRSNSK